MMNLRKLLLPVLLIAVGGAGYYFWLQSQPEPLPEGIASSNGRIEDLLVATAYMDEASRFDWLIAMDETVYVNRLSGSD